MTLYVYLSLSLSLSLYLSISLTHTLSPNSLFIVAETPSNVRYINYIILYTTKFVTDMVHLY